MTKSGLIEGGCSFVGGVCLPPSQPCSDYSNEIDDCQHSSGVEGVCYYNGTHCVHLTASDRCSDVKVFEYFFLCTYNF